MQLLEKVIVVVDVLLLDTLRLRLLSFLPTRLIAAGAIIAESAAGLGALRDLRLPLRLTLALDRARWDECLRQLVVVASVVRGAGVRFLRLGLRITLLLWVRRSKVFAFLVVLVSISLAHNRARSNIERTSSATALRFFCLPFPMAKGVLSSPSPPSNAAIFCLTLHHQVCAVPLFVQPMAAMSLS